MRISTVRLFAASSLAVSLAVIACQGTRFDVSDEIATNDASTTDGNVVAEQGDGNVNPGDASEDAGDAALGPRCKRSTAFGSPVIIPGLAAGAVALRLLPDELTGYYHQDDARIYRVTRATRDSAFGAPEKLPLVFAADSPSDAATHLLSYPSVTGNDLALYVTGDFSIYRAYRDGGAFGPLSAIPQLTRKDPLLLWGPFVSEDGTLVLDTAIDLGLSQINVRASIVEDGSVSAPIVLDSGGGNRDGFVAITGDGNSAYFASSREHDGGGKFQIWMSPTNVQAGKIPKLTDPTPVVELRDYSTDRIPTWISPDNCRLYFTSNAPDGGPVTTYVAERAPE